ncbi:MAG: putative peptidase [Pirellulaceae bacterium]|jgi:predicted peptidase
MNILRIAVTATILFGLTMTQTTDAADNRQRFEALVYESTFDMQLPYRLLKPKNYDATKKYPLVIFFHGAGERGTDNFNQLVHGMSDFASDEVMQSHPCFVIAPQCPAGQMWVDVPWSLDSHTMPKKATPAMRSTIELLDQTAAKYSIDTQRIYVTGLSMGGFGTWDAIQRYPKKFAAAIPVCGGGDTAEAKTIKSVPVWAFHGDKDNAVKTSRSRDMIAAIKKAGGEPKYTEYPGVGHNSWAQTYANRKVYDWLFKQRLGD